MGMSFTRHVDRWYYWKAAGSFSYYLWRAILGIRSYRLCITRWASKSKLSSKTSDRWVAGHVIVMTEPGLLDLMRIAEWPKQLCSTMQDLYCSMVRRCGFPIAGFAEFYSSFSLNWRRLEFDRFIVRENFGGITMEWGQEKRMGQRYLP